jgi:hypothetical protein
LIKKLINPATEIETVQEPAVEGGKVQWFGLSIFHCGSLVAVWLREKRIAESSESTPAGRADGATAISIRREAGSFHLKSKA